MSLKPRELHPLNNRTDFDEFFKSIWYGSPPKLVGKTALTGYLNAPTKSRITKRINEILSRSSKIKIGAMGDTSTRMDAKDYRSSFDFVERVFKSSSEDIIKDLEVELIKKFKKSHPDKVTNISESRAGRLTSYNGYYYVYVVYNPI